MRLFLRKSRHIRTLLTHPESFIFAWVGGGGLRTMCTVKFRDSCPISVENFSKSTAKRYTNAYCVLELHECNDL